jgi:hypothetical protein
MLRDPMTLDRRQLARRLAWRRARLELDLKTVEEQLCRRTTRRAALLPRWWYGSQQRDQRKLEQLSAELALVDRAEAMLRWNADPAAARDYLKNRRVGQLPFTGRR